MSFSLLVQFWARALQVHTFFLGPHVGTFPVSPPVGDGNGGAPMAGKSEVDHGASVTTNPFPSEFSFFTASLLVCV